VAFKGSSRFLYLALVPISLLLSGCNRGSEQCIPGRFGLTETVLGRRVAEQAVLLANLVLPPEQRLRLNITWPAVGYFPSQTFKTDANQNRFRVAETPPRTCSWAVAQNNRSPPGQQKAITTGEGNRLRNPFHTQPAVAARKHGEVRQICG
jgi:hypothetical protein